MVTCDQGRVLCLGTGGRAVRKAFLTWVQGARRGCGRKEEWAVRNVCRVDPLCAEKIPARALK